jgi:hypothetical protein
VALVISIIWVACHCVGFLFVVIFQCVPITSMWDMTVKATCVNDQVMIYAGAGLSIFEDIVIILLPVFILKDLNLNLRKKIALGLVFALGSL